MKKIETENRMKNINEAPISAGARILLRADFNVPIQNGKVVDDFRIRKTQETLDYLKEKNTIVTVVSHIENSTSSGIKPTLKPVVQILNELGYPCEFSETIEAARELSLKKSKEKKFALILLENIRNYHGETKNDPDFAKELATLGNIYINDAFSVSHRAHASIVGVPALLPHFAGFQLAREVDNLSRAFNPLHPFLFILGGAKFDTKLPLVKKFLDKADTIFIGGALANDFFKAKGLEVGQSTVSTSSIDFDGLLSNEKIMLPNDLIVDGTGEQKISSPLDVLPTEKILDAGPETLEELRGKINSAKFILWNGPLGNYENGYKEPTHEVARMIATATKNGAESMIGGGDTLAAITELKSTTGESLENSFTFVSTGGGAMLDFLAKGSLPGIDALNS
ncbi:MAG: phosphoglycerate kinase [Patescibacteria group bacterium]|nr:phosphoglycerate kinase [Patescibacteria group bacterium]